MQMKNQGLPPFKYQQHFRDCLLFAGEEQSRVTAYLQSLVCDSMDLDFILGITQEMVKRNKKETKLFKVDVSVLVMVFGLGSPVNFSSASCIDKERQVAVHHLYPAHQHLLSSPLVSFC